MQVKVRAPKEAGLPKGVCWLAQRALYGLRASPAMWAKFFRELMLSMNFRCSRSEPCVFKHATSSVVVICHVDDLFVHGLDTEVEEFIRVLQTHVKCSQPDWLRRSGDKLLMLGRTIQRTARGFVVTTDPKHCLQVVEEMSTYSTKGGLRRTAVPGRKYSSFEEEKLKAPVDAHRHSVFRRNVGRLIYTSLDRPELMYCIKQLASGLACPTELHWSSLMMIASYLQGREAVVINVSVQLEGGEAPKRIHCFADSDWAGNQTRKSTSGGLVLWGSCPMGFWSRGQSSFAMSSCEAELRAAIRAAAEGLYTVSL